MWSKTHASLWLVTHQSSCSCFADNTVVAVTFSKAPVTSPLNNWDTDVLSHRRPTSSQVFRVRPRRSSCHPSCSCLCHHNYARSPCKRGPNCSSQSEDSKQILARSFVFVDAVTVIPACVRVTLLLPLLNCSSGPCNATMAAACTGAGWPERQELARTHAWMMSDPCLQCGGPCQSGNGKHGDHGQIIVVVGWPS